MTQEKIWNAICKTAESVECFPPMGCYFVYNQRHYLCMKPDKHGMLRFCIPHLVKASVYKPEQINEAINLTNRNVRFVKAMLLSHGSVSLNYDHKIAKGESAAIIVPHIIQSLDFAAEYLFGKLGLVAKK